ncbi:Cytosine/adenosine deaminase [Paraburkholderia steynii]|uniref:Cytosine/adenosine deaminase n=1 Tax=Paraburkholderia steynii TaxID=1245441 RepID=A0A7Z7BBJ6_9BURK|nr:amidohydrolase family protein [Paraburkholderia steynii]SDI57711.1 Cytosine/adenosine deaminase [Paraburkholderia steynii]
MNRKLIRDVWIVTNDERLGNIRKGSILIEKNTILAVGEDVLAPQDTEIIDGQGFIAIPGFVDAHKHLWQTALRGICADQTILGYFQLVREGLLAAYRQEDVRIGTYASALELINGGATAALDHAHCIISPEHADAAVEATLSSGLRGIWAYGYCPHSEEKTFHRHHDRIVDAKRVKSRYFSSEDQILRMGVAITEQNLLPFEFTEMEICSAIDMNVKWTGHTHCNNGPAPFTRGIHKLYAKGFLGPLSVLSHCNEFSYNDFCMIKEVGAHFVSTPDSEIYMGISKPTNFIDAISAGIDIALGTDTVTVMSADMFANMRLTMNFARHQVNHPAAAGFQSVPEQRVSVRDIFRWATINGAKALGIDHLVGSIVPGKRADIVLIDPTHPNLAPVIDPVFSLVMHGQVSNVDTVLIDGQIRKRGGHLVDVDLEKVGNELVASHEHLMDKRKTANSAVAEEVEGWTERLRRSAVA